MSRSLAEVLADTHAMTVGARMAISGTYPSFTDVWACRQLLDSIVELLEGKDES